MLFKPSKYYKDIYSINYNKLKEEGIKCLIFDLDNTLGLISEKECPRKTKLLIKKLKEDFLVLVCSNNNRTRLKPYLEDLGIGGVSWSMKPLTRGLRKIKRNYHLKKKEMAIIGDQIVTDIYAGNKYRIKTILVDPLGEKDMKVTFFNRKIENYIVNKYSKRGAFTRGEYYE
jgi:HAD superfamily phosphatase (TIGR01668 family)